MKTEFKATKENLLALVEAANNTNGTGDFVEAGEAIPLSEHPLRKEIKATRGNKGRNYENCLF